VIDVEEGHSFQRKKNLVFKGHTQAAVHIGCIHMWIAV
jgi:hypothetical protein